MVKRVVLVFSICVIGSNGSAFRLHSRHFINDYYGSSSLECSIPEKPKIDCRYIVYGNDESTCFADAITISTNTQYGFYFNNYYDEDYFNCYLSAGDIISVSCNKEYRLRIYKYVGPNLITYFSNDSYNGDKIVFDSTGTYCFKVSELGSYTGKYYLQLNSFITANYANNNNYVNIKYHNGLLQSTLLATFTDLFNLPTYGYKPGYYGSINNTPFVNDYIGTELLRLYANNGSSYGSMLFTNEELGPVFDSNGYESYNIYNDDRMVFNYDTYLASATPFMVSKYDYGRLLGNVYNTHYDRATSFFVDNNYAISAGHMVYHPVLKRFTNEITLITEKNPNNNLLNMYEISCVELYIPYSFVYYHANNTGSNDYVRQFDWCIMKLNTSNIPSTYSHSYLGLQFPCDTSLSYYNVGFPRYIYNPENNATLTNDPECNNFRILAGMSGSIFLNNGLINTYMDITHGHSGGPCLYQEQNNTGVSVGIVSGKTQNNGVAFCPINQYSFEILSRFLGGLL